jgi:hypothetical protein
MVLGAIVADVTVQQKKHPGDKRLQQAAEEAFEAVLSIFLSCNLIPFLSLPRYCSSSDQMVDYCKSSTCRRKKILKYFNEITTGDVFLSVSDMCLRCCLCLHRSLSLSLVSIRIRICSFR